MFDSNNNNSNNHHNNIMSSNHTLLFPSSTTGGATKQHFAGMEATVAALGLTIMSFATILANSLVLYVFKRNKRLWKPKYYCIVSLAIADLLVGLISVNPYTVTIITGIWPLGHVACQIWLVLDHTLVTVSNATLLVIAFDRFASICYPISHRVRFDCRFMRRCIIGSWTLSALVWSPAILIYPYLADVRQASDTECFIHFYERNIPVTSTVVFFSYIAPCIILIVLYATISCKITKTEKRSFIRDTLKTAVVAQPSIGSEFCSSTIHRLDEIIGGNSTPIFTVHQQSRLRLRSSTETTLVSTASFSSSYAPNTPKTKPKPSEPVILKSCAHINPNIELDEPNNIERKMSTLSVHSIPNKSSNNSTSSSPQVKRQLTTPSCDKKLDSKKTMNRKSKTCVSSRIQAKRKALKWILLVSSAFVISWAPYHITVLVRPILKHDLPASLWKFCYIFGWLNSLFNPVCYAYANQHFNRSFKKIFCKT